MMEYFGFKRLTVDSSEWVTPTTKRITFASTSASPDGQAGDPVKVEVGTALLTLLYKPNAYFPTPRPYTPISGSFSSGALELLVRQVPHGAGSPVICGLKPGDELLARTIKRYTWTPNLYKRIGLVAGGTGITPCMQLMRGILADEADKTNVNLVYGCRLEAGGKDAIPLKREIDDLIRQHPGRVKATFLVTPAADSANSGAPVEGDATSDSGEEGQVVTGRITKEVLEKHLPPSSENTRIFVSGPPAMEDLVAGRKGILSQLGFGRKMVQTF